MVAVQRKIQRFSRLLFSSSTRSADAVELPHELRVGSPMQFVEKQSAQEDSRGKILGADSQDSVSQGSITQWIHEVKLGNHAAASELWDRYFSQLARLARQRLTKSSRQTSDEEDLVVSVFDRFVRAAEKGQFDGLSDRTSFWRLLVRMMKRKLIDRHRYESRLRRANHSQSIDVEQWHALADDAPSPQLAAIMADEMARLLECLPEDRLKVLTLGKLEGYTNEEMAEQMSVSVRTVERLMARLRELLSPELEQPS